MNNLLSAIKSFILKSRPAYKDYLGNGKYVIKKLPEECVPDSVNDKIRRAQSKANEAQSTANEAQSTANEAQSTANNAWSTATGTERQINNVTTFVTVFNSVEATKNKEKHNFVENISLNGTSALPFAEAKAPMKCYFDIMLNDSSNHRIKHYAAFEGKIVRGVTKRSDTYCWFIDESVEVVNNCFAKLKIGYKFANDDNLWHKIIRAEVTLPDADFNNTSITTIILNARGVIPDTYHYAPWPSICVPLAGTYDAGVVYASDKTDDQTVPVSIDKNGYLWCKGSETTTPDWNQNDQTASDYIKNRPFYTGGMVQIEIIPEHTYTLSSAGSFTMYSDESGTYPYSLEDGKNYIVVYNGTTYELTSSIASGIPYVGDIGPLRGEEATVPFAIVAGNGLLQIVDYNSNTEVTFKIIGNNADIIQIDLKYIPELPRYMSKQNPVGYGSFSLNRKADTTIGLNSHTEGNETTASGFSSHTEGNETTASGSSSHAEGDETTASGFSSHAEGSFTKASGYTSHTEGLSTTASGNYSHTEGAHTTASEGCSHAEGYYTMASGENSHVQGRYNINDSDGKYAHIVGNGTSNTARSNAHTLDWEGNAWYAGTVEGTAMIVKSSTTNSTKKFKITVDDTGTISATEVT